MDRRDRPEPMGRLPEGRCTKRARRGQTESVLLVALVALAAAPALGRLGDAERRAIADEASGAGVGRAAGGRSRDAVGVGPAVQAGILRAAAHGAEHARGAAVRAADAAEGSASFAERLPARGAMHGENSLYWQLAKQGTLLFGGQRALLLQVADPAVARGVSRFSQFKDNPVERLARTMDAMTAIAFGTPEQRASMLAHLEKVHARVRGRTEDGAKFSATDPALQFWIHATLVDTALTVERRFAGKFTDADRARYYEESKALARAFGIGEEHIPADYAAFQRYMDARVRSLRPSAESRDLAAFLLKPEVRGVPGPALVPLAWVTRSLLPTPLREAYGLPKLSRAERLAVRGIEGGVRAAVPPLMGLALRFDPARKLLDQTVSRLANRTPAR